MNREIKFRAFVGKMRNGKGIMYPVLDIDFYIGSLHTPVLIEKVGSYTEPYFDYDKTEFWHLSSFLSDKEWETTGKYILMQFTGLIDKNGKEIFEGDIIDFGGLKPIEIIWKDNGFKTKLIPYENSDPIQLTQEGLSAFGNVIGNIYEKPELLPDPNQ